MESVRHFISFTQIYFNHTNEEQKYKLNLGGITPCYRHIFHGFLI